MLIAVFPICFKENDNNGNHWFADSRFYYSSLSNLSNRHFFNNKKHQEITSFRKMFLFLKELSQ